MRRRSAVRVIVVVLVVLASAGWLVSEEKSPWGIFDKAFYADQHTLNFVRPGLVFTITEASIGEDRTIRTKVRVTDPRGVPLDRAGNITPGPVSMSFVAGTIPVDAEQYRSYTNRTQTSPINGVSAIQPTGENNGTFREIELGLYEYTFRTLAPADIDRTATHTIGVYGSRNLSEFDLGNDYDDFVFNFIPNGGEVTHVRDIVTNESCNTCHGNLSFHGGARSTMGLCVMCHTQGVIDPDTGNSVDFKVMVHKIHMGRNLPRVQDGGRYYIIGNNQAVYDFSDINFPSDNRQCAQCHDGNSSQAQNHLTNPKRESCGSCHERVNWTTGEGHAGGPATNDNACSRCHIPQGEIEFDASVAGAHTIPTQSRDLPGVVFTIVGVDNARPGQQPTVRFQIADNAGNTILPREMNALNVIMAGPTTDYTFRANNSVLAAAALPDGKTYAGTLNASIPADATGTFAFGIEGNRAWTLQPGTDKEVTVNDAGNNRIFYAALDGGTAQPRRQIVSMEKCNACHTELSYHGVNRNNVDVCAMCHNPMRPVNSTGLSANLTNLTHRLHAEGRYPNAINRCDACHSNDTQNVPTGGVATVVQPAGPINPIQPQTSACTSCHTSIAAASHALTNTSSLGEACVVCHGPNATFSVNRVHAQ